MATIADSMIAEGCEGLDDRQPRLRLGRDDPEEAKDAGIKTIDYDRLTLGGGADVYISFDNVQVGTLQGEGLVKCLTSPAVETPKIAILNGSPTDNNATLFKQGYDAVLQPYFDDGSYELVDDQSVPDWDNQKGGQIFEQMLATAGGSVDGVLAANDGLGGAAIAVLQKNNLQVPVTGQDASVDGLRNILTGDQCMTVYKAVKTEAEAAAAAAIALASGAEPETNGTVTDTQLNTEVPLSSPPPWRSTRTTSRTSSTTATRPSKTSAKTSKTSAPQPASTPAALVRRPRQPPARPRAPRVPRVRVGSSV